MTKIQILLICSLCFLMTACNIAQIPNASVEPTPPPSDIASIPSDDRIETEVPTEETIASKPPLDITFTYQELPLSDELAQADHLFCCYQDASTTLLSVCADNGALFGPLNNTIGFAQYHTDGTYNMLPVTTDAYITSAIAYQDGVLYADYQYNNSGQCDWTILYTDGIQQTVIDFGTVATYDRVPKLFQIDNTACYLWERSKSFGICQLDGFTVNEIFTRSDCELVDLNLVNSTERYCFMIQYAGNLYATAAIGNLSGIQHEHYVEGKLTSFAISSKYAVIGYGKEENQSFYVDAIELATFQALSYPSISALWGLHGTGDLFVAVGHSWEPYYIYIPNGTVESMSPPVTGHKLRPTFFYPYGDTSFVVLRDGNDEHAFYLLEAKIS